MAQTAQITTSPWEGAEADRSFLWRRLHSLSGVLPVGFFLLFHTFENSAAIAGPHAYDSGIAHLASLLPVPYFYLIEVFVLAIPILFHGLYGAYLALEAKPNNNLLPYRRNAYYLLQRITGVIALAFILYHVVSLRINITMRGLGGGVEGHPGYVSFADMVTHYASPAVLAFYIVGVLSSAWHFANGLNGFCWTWGIGVGERSRKWIEAAGWGLFFVMAIPMMHILWSFRAAGH